MKRHYCTYFDMNYLAKGLSLIESLEMQGADDCEIHVLCLDEVTRIVMDRRNRRNVHTVPLHKLERLDSALLQAKRNRELVEYYWTLTPTLILYLLQTHPEIDVLNYLDADLYFYASPEAIFHELEGHSILIHEHRFSPSLKHLEKFGRYNVGWLSFRNDPNSMEVLNWWRERCIEWCYTRLENGKFGDQLYLNDWPERFKGVTVLRHQGAGVAPWNHDQYAFSRNCAGELQVNGRPLIFYHFHGLSLVHPGVVIPAVHHHPLTEEILSTCFLPYIHTLQGKIAELNAISPDLFQGCSEHHVLTTAHSFMVRNGHDEAMAGSGIPQVPLRLDQEWVCFCSPQIVRFSERNRKMEELIKARDFRKIRSIDIQPIKGAEGTVIENADTLNRQGETLFNKGNLDGALCAFRRAASLDDRMAEVHNNLGVVHWRQGRLEDAVQEFTKAFEIDPQDRDATLNCGDIFHELGKPHDAEAIYLVYLKNHPDDEEVRARLDACRSGLFSFHAATQPSTPTSSVTDMIQEGDLVFDVGANIGSKAAKYLERGARVVLFEPQPDCVETLRKRFGDDPRVTIVHKGLDRNAGRRPLLLCRETNVLSTFSEKWKTGRFRNYHWDASVLVDVTTLDEAIKIYGLPKYCKIDVEGYESSVLQGLSRPIPFISFEFTWEFLEQTRKCMSILESVGYREFNLSLAESGQLLLHEWAGPSTILNHISGMNDPALWGDIYARIPTSACDYNLESITGSAGTPDSGLSDSTGEVELLSFLVQSQMIPRRGVVFDVGANVGAWTSKLLGIDPRFRVHLFEPVASTYGTLLKNMAPRIQDCCLTLNNSALAAAEGTRTFYFYKDASSWSTFFRRKAVEEEYRLAPPKENAIYATTLDLYCDRMGIRHIHFLKLDVEGAELEVLRGGRDFLRRNRIDFLQFEYGGTFSDAGITLKEVFSLLQDHGYLIFKISPQKMAFLPSFSPAMEDYQYANFLAANERFRTLLFKTPPRMLEFKELFQKHGVLPKGVIHVGAHEGNEAWKYLDMGAAKVLLIEANPLVFERLARNTSAMQDVMAVNCAVTDCCGTASLHITSVDQSSSILPLKRHKDIYPEIRETDRITVRAMTLDTLLQDLNVAPDEFNFLSMDIQGAELMALRGAAGLLKHLDAINLKVNFEELYEGGALVEEIDDFLEREGFERAATVTPYHPSWGDAFYRRKPVLSMSTLGRNGRFANQIFQYAFLKTYAKINGLRVETPRWVGTDLFGCADPPIQRPLPVFREEESTLSKAIIPGRSMPVANVDLWGYFQYNTAYYAPEKDYFRSLFVPVPRIEQELSKGTRKLRSMGKTIVGLHLRRGDYGYDYFFVAPCEWYKQWLEGFWETLEEPVLFIASDEPSKVIGEFDQYSPVISADLGMTMPEAEYYPDFYLLTQCDALAISNSSFSFAAALLNTRATHFFRPHLPTRKLISFEPWRSEVIFRDAWVKKPVCRSIGRTKN